MQATSLAASQGRALAWAAAACSCTAPGCPPHILKSGCSTMVHRVDLKIARPPRGDALVDCRDALPSVRRARPPSSVPNRTHRFGPAGQQRIVAVLMILSLGFLPERTDSRSGHRWCYSHRRQRRGGLNFAGTMPVRPTFRMKPSVCPRLGAERHHPGTGRFGAATPSAVAWRRWRGMLI